MKQKRRTFAILKPTNPWSQVMIIERLENAGFHITTSIMGRTLDTELLQKHYAHHVDKSFFSPMIRYLTSGKSVLLILERTDDLDPVQSLRDLIGPTDPKKGKPGQIRHDFGIKDPDVIFMNAIHASESAEEAEKEIEFFKIFPWDIFSALKNISIVGK